MASQVARSKKSPADAQEARINRQPVTPTLGKLAIGWHAVFKNSMDDQKAIRENTKANTTKVAGLSTPLNLTPMKRNKKSGTPYQDRDINLKELPYETRAKIKTAARKAKKSISSPA